MGQTWTAGVSVFRIPLACLMGIACVTTPLPLTNVRAGPSIYILWSGVCPQLARLCLLYVKEKLHQNEKDHLDRQMRNNCLQLLLQHLKTRHMWNISLIPFKSPAWNTFIVSQTHLRCHRWGDMQVCLNFWEMLSFSSHVIQAFTKHPDQNTLYFFLFSQQFARKFLCCSEMCGLSLLSDFSSVVGKFANFGQTWLSEIGMVLWRFCVIRKNKCFWQICINLCSTGVGMVVGKCLCGQLHFGVASSFSSGFLLHLSCCFLTINFPIFSVWKCWSFFLQFCFQLLTPWRRLHLDSWAATSSGSETTGCARPSLKHSTPRLGNPSKESTAGQRCIMWVHFLAWGRGGSRILVRALVEFSPQGGWTHNLLNMGVFHLKLPKNCMILKKNLGGQGGPPPVPLDPLVWGKREYAGGGGR